MAPGFRPPPGMPPPNALMGQRPPMGMSGMTMGATMGMGMGSADVSCKLYVGKIPQTVTDEFIKQILDSCGEVVKWTRPSDPETQQLKGFGYCEYANPEAVSRALRLLTDFKIDENQLLIKADDKTKRCAEQWEATQDGVEYELAKEAEDARVKEVIEKLMQSRKGAEPSPAGRDYMADMRERRERDREARIKDRETDLEHQYKDREREWLRREEMKEREKQKEVEREKALEKEKERLLASNFMEEGEEDGSRRRDREERKRRRQREREDDEREARLEAEEMERKEREAQEALAAQQAKAEEMAIDSKRGAMDQLGSPNAEQLDLSNANVTLGFNVTSRITNKPAIFEMEEGDDNPYARKHRPLVRLDEESANHMKDIKERGQRVLTLEEQKQLLRRIPEDPEALFKYSIEWDSLYECGVVEKKVRPWVAKKVKELLGEEEPTMVNVVIKKVLTKPEPKVFLELLQPVLEEETEGFVQKLWRTLAFESLRLQS
eukprot:GILJ01006611.1.p1 GENE.GILJ01006611.1~~GILJ01006611.1.p1  ORF type:complete len:529 (-),score=108.03 GILJ01006611.1:121-1599(-)